MLKLPENIASQTQDFNAKIDALVVSSQEEYHIAGEYYKLLADMERQIKDFFKPHKENAWKAHKALVEAEDNELIKVRTLKNKLSSLMLTNNSRKAPCFSNGDIRQYFRIILYN